MANLITIEQLQNRIICADCLDILKQLPDKCVDLVLTDPPYGIGASNIRFKNGNNKTGGDRFVDKNWDNNKISQEYFIELFRISKNQIIFGWNYYSNVLPTTRCFIVWDKTIHGNSYADCEIAFASFDKVARIIPINMVSTTLDGRIHPTQKPLKLFEMILQDYSNENDLVLDCFSGSGTTAVACHNLKRRFVCIEKDPEYAKASQERLEQAQRQQTLF